MKREILQSLRVLACVGTLMAGTVAVLAAQEPEPDEARSPSIARQRSILGTVVPIAAGFALSATGVTAFDDLEGLLVVGGLIFGPVPGYAYAGEQERGMAHAYTRAAVLGATFGLALLLSAAEGDTQRFGPSPAGEVVIVAGGVATIWLELPAQLSRRATGFDQLDHLLPELRRIRISRPGHRGLLFSRE